MEVGSVSGQVEAEASAKGSGKVEDMVDDSPRPAEIISPDESGEIPSLRVYDFDSMEVGASMFCADEKKAKSVVAAAHCYAKSKGTEFKMARRKMHGGYRVWRIK